MKSLTRKQAIQQTSDILAKNGIEEENLEAQLLLCCTLGCDRTELLTWLDQSLSGEQECHLEKLVRRRLRHEPIAYITGSKEFFGLDFQVNSSVLIPRPETEVLIEAAMQMPNWLMIRSIADVGTGSGALAITLAVHQPYSRIYATDISADALRIAAVNCIKHGVDDRVHLLEGALLKPVPQPVDLIVANLPYVSDGEMEELSCEIRLYEPSTALRGGLDGLEYFDPFLSQAEDVLNPGGAIMLEISPWQREAVAGMAARHFPCAVISTRHDMAGNDRAIIIDTSGM